MTASALREVQNRLVIIVGIDLTDVSDHLIANARALVRSAGPQAELHLVHVIHHEPLRSRLNEPISSRTGAEEQSHQEAARFEMQQIADRMVGDTGAVVHIHTPVGRAADEIISIAATVGADLIIVEAHDAPWTQNVFHRSVVSRISHRAPCSVLTSRPKAPRRAAERGQPAASSAGLRESTR